MIYFTYDFLLLLRIVLAIWIVSRIIRAIVYKKINLFREILLLGMF